MTKEEKVLFCKIAIHNNLLGTEDANSVLREAAEEGREIGEIFIERRILSEAQVEKIKRAVLKRSAQKRAPAAEKRAGPVEGKRRKREPRKKRKKRPAGSQNTNQLVIAGVSFLVIVVVAVVLILKLTGGGPEKRVSTGTEGKGKETAQEAPSGTEAPSIDPSLMPGGTSEGGPPGGEGAGPGPSREPVLSGQEKRALEEEYQQVRQQAVTATTPYEQGSALKAIDNLMDRATDEQREELLSLKKRIENALQNRFKEDKEAYIAAFERGDKEEAEELKAAIMDYADAEMKKEMKKLEEQLSSGSG